MRASRIDLLTEGPTFEIEVAKAQTIDELNKLMISAVEGTNNRSLVSRYLWSVLLRAFEIGHDTL